MDPSLSRVDLNLLLVLDALLTEQGVTKASKRLFVTQSAVSGSLLKLREIFDDQLLVRNGRQMELTARGRSLVQPVRDVLRNIQNILSLREDFHPATAKRTFRVAMSDYCMMTLMPKLVRRITKVASAIRIVVESVGPASFERLEVGEVDLCVMPNEQRSLRKPAHPEFLRDHALYEDHFVCCVAEDHPLGKTMTIDEYQRFPHARAFFGEDMMTVDELAFEQLGISVPGIVQIPSFSLLLYQLPGTHLIATVPSWIARIFESSLAVRTIRPPVELPLIAESLIWHQRYDADRGLSWLRGVIIEEGEMLDKAGLA